MKINVHRIFHFVQKCTVGSSVFEMSIKLQETEVGNDSGLTTEGKVSKNKKGVAHAVHAFQSVDQE